jgi:hypothetical protein
MLERYKEGMGLRLLRIIILLWIGWYLTGPLAETVDRWDGPRQEMHDILFNAGGGVTLFACAFCIVIHRARKLRERCSLPLGIFQRQPSGLAWFSPASLFLSPHAATHSPPLPLRL